jgi:hypothetical protein
MIKFKVWMVAAGGEFAGCLARVARSPQDAMDAAEKAYPHLAAYTAVPLAPFDYSTVGGMMAAPRQ